MVFGRDVPDASTELLNCRGRRGASVSWRVAGAPVTAVWLGSRLRGEVRDGRISMRAAAQPDGMLAALPAGWRRGPQRVRAGYVPVSSTAAREALGRGWRGVDERGKDPLG